ncbi:MAG: hydrogenase expression/formation protein HypE [Candidatus Binatia bacterium]
MREPRVTLRHGAGGGAMRGLIEQVLAAPFLGNGGHEAGGVGLAAMDDGAVLRVGDHWLVVTTDSHVIHPIVFPGGDIGRLAVAGTVNDLAMMGATRVLGLTCAMIIEEGFPLERLERIVSSMAATCREAGAAVVTGDTKVMGRGELDGIVINTTGVAITDRIVTDAGLRPGDRLVVSGTIGDHGFAILSARHGLELGGTLVSDVAPLVGVVEAMLGAGGADVVALKDPTRGGLASALHEMATKSGVGIVLDEAALPIAEAVRAAAELTGIDPLHVANEGKLVAGVRPAALHAVLAALRAHPLGRNAACVGTCVEGPAGRVVLDTGFGRRLLAEPEGEPLPRIC